MNQKIVKSEFTGWAVVLGVLATLYLTGLQTEVLGRVQQLVLFTGFSKPEVDITAARNQSTTSHDFPLVTLDGKTINLNDFKGKVIFLNLWATWCPPCIAEMPNIHKLYEKVSSEDIAFVMVSLDEDIEKAKKFVKRKEYKFPVYGIKNGLPALFETNSIPTTFVIAPDGKIVMRKEGMAQYDTEEFIDFITKLAKAQ